MSLRSTGQVKAVIPRLKEDDGSGKKDPNGSSSGRTNEEIFDDLMNDIQVKPKNQAIERAFRHAIDGVAVVLWIVYKNENCMFSPTLSRTIPLDLGVCSFCLLSKSIQVFEKQSNHSSYREKIDSVTFSPNSAVILVPLINKSDEVVAVVEIARNDPFTDADQQVVSYLGNKIKAYSKFIFDGIEILHAASNLVGIDSLSKTVEKISSSLQSFFRANEVQFYMHKVKENITVTLDPSKDTPVNIPQDQLGIVGQCFKDNVVINEKAAKNNKYFDSDKDGNGELSLLIVPYEQSENRIWAICLRGRVSPSIYTKQEENLLLALAPFAIKSVSTALMPPSDLPQINDFEKRLAVLLEVAETLSGVLDIETLIPTIMQRACSLLHADRCSLFLVDKGRNEVVTQFAGGLKDAIRIPIARGIVGHTAMTGNVVNIKDAYEDKRFDRTVDQMTGFRTVSLLTVPIFNNRGEINGVTEMINKSEGEAFTEDDVRMMMAFNVFCGTSLDNARLYKASLDLTRQLRSFTEMSAALGGASKSLLPVLEEILESARQIVSASRATMYRYDTNERNLIDLANIGVEPKFGYVFAQEVINSRSAHIFDQDEIARLTQTTQLESAIEKLISNEVDIPQQETSSVNRSNRSSRSSLVSVTPHVQPAAATNEYICCIPLMDSSQVILGVMELACNWKIVEEDMRLLDCFAVFAAVAIERNNLKDIAEHGQVEVELKHWLTQEERQRFSPIPARLGIPQNVLDTIWTINFDAPAWDGIGHFKVLFNIFERFGLLQEFNVSNEKFFRFLTGIKDTYKKVPYHNWRHAVDVTQFVTYELITSGYDKILSRFELFGLLVACVCHDANHDGFTNVYNVKAETPLGILFKNQSVMETHHCAVSIDIISKEECNIFSTLNPAEYKTMWNLIIQLILITDMAKHFTFLKEFNTKFDEGKWDPKTTEDRLVLMQMILKCGDISNVSRPFNLADKWCDVLCEEFFRQGDLEMANGMEYTSDLNDRAHLDKPKSQIGFYNFVCLPLYVATAKAIPKLQCNVDQIQSNLAVWKKAQEDAKLAAERAEHESK